MDESGSDKMLRPEVEVILTDDQFDPEMTEDNGVRIFYMILVDDLFQMPIAPCEGDRGYVQERY
jgi:hypothetical protein